MTAAGIAALAFAGAVTFAGLRDVFTMTIANRLVIWLAAGFIVAAPIAGIGPDQIASSAFTGAVVLAGGFLLFAFGWIGGGDAKLAAVAALWLGQEVVLDFVLLASVFGAVLAIAVLAFRRVSVPEFLSRAAWVAKLHRADAGVPYGPALAASALALLPQSQWAAVISGIA